jgi:hypothetical protein
MPFDGSIDPDLVDVEAFAVGAPAHLEDKEVHIAVLFERRRQAALDGPPGGLAQNAKVVIVVEVVGERRVGG